MAPTVRAWTRRLPRAVPSFGPAINSKPVASAVIGREVGLVLGAILDMQFLQARDRVLDGGSAGQVEQKRFDLGSQEVVGAVGAERDQTRVLDAREEVKDLRCVGEVADLCPVGGDQTPDRGASAAAFAFRSEGGSAPNPLSSDPKGSAFECAAMYAAAVSMIHGEFVSASPLVSPHAVMP